VRNTKRKTSSRNADTSLLNRFMFVCLLVCLILFFLFVSVPLYPFRWSTGEWQPCSSSCIGGVQNRTVSCVRQFSNLYDDDALKSTAWRLPKWEDLDEMEDFAIVVPNTRCKMNTATPRPGVERQCNQQIPCQTKRNMRNESVGLAMAAQLI
jgi:hypothetical protein